MPLAAYISLAIIIVIAAFLVYLVIKGRADKRAHEQWEAQQRNAAGPTAAPGSASLTTPAPGEATAEPEEDTVDDHDDEPQATIESLTKEGDDLYLKGENGDALDKYNDALEMAREQFHDSDPRLAAALMNYAKADIGYNGDDWDEDTVPTELLEALSIVDRAHGPTSERILPALEALVGFYDRVGNHNKSATLLSRIATTKANSRLEALAQPAPAPASGDAAQK